MRGPKLTGPLWSNTTPSPSFQQESDKWGFGYLIGWFVGGTSCTLQTLYAWLMRGFGTGMVGIPIYRVLHLSLRCDSWYACYVINLGKIIQSVCTYYSPFIIHTNICNTVVTMFLR